MRHHIFRRAVNLTFAFLLAVFSVNLSGVLALENAQAWSHGGTYQPVWCHLTGNHWTIQQGTGDHSDSAPLLMTNAIRALGSDDVDTSVPNGSQVKENDRSDKIDATYCATQFTLTAPTPTITGVCGLNNDTVTVASNTNYTSSFGGWSASQGTVTVTADAPYLFTGNKTSVSIPVTELNTATCIVKDATADVKVSAATCNDAAVATLNGVAHATLTSNGGVLDQSVGTHTATFTASAGHAFSAGNATLDVTYTISAQPSGADCAGPKPTDVKETRVITNDPVCSPNGGGTVASWTEQRTHSWVISGNSWVAGPWTDWTKVPNSDTSRHATYAECPINVTPAAPTFVDNCGTYGDKFTIPSKTGVDYYVNGVKKSHGTYQTSVDVTIVAVAKTNYALTGTTSWTFDLSQNGCPATATEPTVANVCGSDGDRYTIPDIEGVQYQVSKFGVVYTDVDAGSHWAAGTFYVRAVAKPGYDLTGNDNSWTHYLNPNACDVNAPKPESVDPCGTSGDNFTVPQIDHVTYKQVTHGWFWLWFPFIGWPTTSYQTLTPGEHTGNGSVEIKAFADDNYAINGADSWTLDFTDGACPAPHVTAVALCDREGIVVTLTNDGDADGNAWINGFNEDQPINVPKGESVEVTVPFVDFKANVSIIDDNETPLLNEDFDCTPGRGDILPTNVATADPFYTDSCGVANDTYGVVPTTGVIYKVNGVQLAGAGPFSTNGASSVTVTAEAEQGYALTGTSQWTYNFTNNACAKLAGITLPDTGSNPLQQLITVIVAGILAYGATFFLVNRRNLSQK